MLTQQSKSFEVTQILVCCGVNLYVKDANFECEIWTIRKFLGYFD